MKTFLDMRKVDIHDFSLPITGKNEVCGPISARLEVPSGNRSRVLGVTRIRGFL
jgi:hypothetical protein